MLPEVSRLLILGPDKDSNLAVAFKLRELCGDSNYETLVDNKLDVVVLNLQTKYYHARVEVHLHQVLDNEPEPPLHHELRDYEALICVFDAKEKDTFLHMQRFVKCIVDTLSYDVCLLVSTSSTLSMTMESVQQVETWCQDNGFEFVALDCLEHLFNDDNVIHEKKGIERVLEALHCNMWRSMEMNPSQSVTATPLQMVTEDAEKEVDNVEKKEILKEENNANTEDQRTSMDESQLHTLLQDLEIPGGPGICAGESKGDNKENDIDMNQFNALISEVRNVRNQGQHLTDEERRDRAAEVAMKLWKVLGEEDSD
ncbi:unnamed protein product [Peronospora farinosa]|uniref:Increased recombination centers protein 6 n=1 Tax=Peronospora farinosa TaxID=134698 RepID=A0AAV0TRH7_9STRA|nr:unnamed protein product [Peronospora farinosa]